MINIDNNIEFNNLRYVPRDAVELLSEFTESYQILESQINDFIRTQPTFLNEIRKKLRGEIGFLSSRQKDIALSIYGLIVTDEIIKNYDPFNYANDISTLLDATNKKNKCTEEEFIGLITSFINSLQAVLNITDLVINNFIQFKSYDIPDDIIIMLLIRRHYYPAINEINLMFEAPEFTIDLRWVVAIFAYILEYKLEKNNQIRRVQTIGEIYSKIVKIYPLSEGEEIVTDIIYLYLIRTYIDKLSNGLSSRIDILKLSLKSETELEEETEKNMAVKSFYPKQDSSSEQIVRLIEKPIIETLEMKVDFNEDERRKLEVNIESALKRIAIEESRTQNFTNENSYNLIIKKSWMNVFEQHPQMIIPIININQYTKFVNEPKAYVKENENEIVRQLQFKIRHYIGGERMNSKSLAKAFSRLLFEILNNPSVKKLTF